jgi:hypothetical protein
MNSLYSCGVSMPLQFLQPPALERAVFDLVGFVEQVDVALLNRKFWTISPNVPQGIFRPVWPMRQTMFEGRPFTPQQAVGARAKGL